MSEEVVIVFDFLYIKNCRPICIVKMRDASTPCVSYSQNYCCKVNMRARLISYLFDHATHTDYHADHRITASLVSMLFSKCHRSSCMGQHSSDLLMRGVVNLSAFLFRLPFLSGRQSLVLGDIYICCHAKKQSSGIFHQLWLT